ncbi:MAG: glycoside hydrolase family 3 N-terminal domain-containing protein [Ktedonobacteraceae bacterium]
MTISHQPPRKPSDSGSAQPFRIPARPSPAHAPEQALPDKHREGTAGPSIVRTELLEQNTLHSFQPPPMGHAYNRERASLPLVAAPPTRKKRGLLVVLLASLAVLVVFGGLLGQHLLNTNPDAGNQGALNFLGNGPYARLPLSADRINAIMHLPEHMKDKALASLYVSQMNLDDEIGQLIMLEYNAPSYNSDLDYAINTLHVGGVIMYEFQMTTFDQAKNDIAHMQKRANIPLLISTDEEGGPYVHRLKNIYGLRMSATQIFDTGDVNVATQQGLKVSQQLAALGINEDLTPDVDTNQVNGFDMVSRTFGNTPAEVIKFAGAYIQAMQGNGTVGCIKHYPGLGGASPDAHATLPVVNSTKQQIYDLDLAPFKAFIQSPNTLLNPGMIMPTDVLMPAIDPKYPAELSHIFMTDILRNEFHYDGVALTDALYMKGITDTWPMNTAAVMALQAGNDMLLGANDTGQTLSMINAIKQALKDGQLSKARIDEAATRIIALKMQYHLMPATVPVIYS